MAGEPKRPADESRRPGAWNIETRPVMVIALGVMIAGVLGLWSHIANRYNCHPTPPSVSARLEPSLTPVSRPTDPAPSWTRQP